MPETILVTGGAGFIGSHVCDKLLSMGYRVICLDNLDPYYSPIRKIKNVQHNFHNSNFLFITEDITKKEQLEMIFRNNDIDKVIHLAAKAGVRASIEKPLLYSNVNINGTINLLELSKKYNIKNFIFGSSSSVYGKVENVPFTEESAINCLISPYAASKRACELICHTYNYLFGLNITCLRFFTVYGPRGRPDMAPYLFTKWVNEDMPIKVYGDGRTKRDYTFISDIVDGIISALRKKLRFEIINLGSGKPVELRHLINIIEEALGKKAKIKQLPLPLCDVPITHADITKAKRILNYNPKINIEEGMKRFVRWFIEEQC